MGNGQSFIQERQNCFLTVGVSVNCRENNDDTPVLCAAKKNHFEMVQLLVKHGADLSLKDKEGIRPYIATKKNNNVEVAAYIKAHEPAEFYNEEVQDKIFKDYHVPKDMAAYLKNGNLKLEFPKEERLHWIKLYSYMDVPEITYQGKSCFPWWRTAKITGFFWYGSRSRKKSGLSTRNMKSSMRSALGWNLLKMQDTTQIGLSCMSLINVISVFFVGLF